MSMQIATSGEDFRDLREQGFEYIDKTHLITAMLKWFFEKRDENVWHLFEGLQVARMGEKYREHFQKKRRWT